MLDVRNQSEIKIIRELMSMQKKTNKILISTN